MCQVMLLKLNLHQFMLVYLWTKEHKKHLTGVVMLTENIFLYGLSENISLKALWKVLSKFQLQIWVL